ncbi:MAG: hypothetical protein ACSHX6_00900 [Akkermansiaceae bacterium]
MKKYFLTYLLLALSFTQLAKPDEEVTLMKLATNLSDHPHFPEWRAAGVSNSAIKKTFLSIVSAPAKEDVKRVVFISAGQQTDDPFGEDHILSENYNKGYTNVLTGQPDNYKNLMVNDLRKEATMELNAKSLASKLITSGKFPKESTLFLLACDAQFGYFITENEKKRRETAYYNFLTSRVNPANLEIIVLAGQSRGGALMFRLASRIRQTSSFAKVPMVVQGYDPVCKNPKYEYKPISTEQYLEVYENNSTTINPHDNSKYCWKVNMDVTFPPHLRENLFVYILHSGGMVAKDLKKSIRAFTWKNSNTDLGWYKQHWLNYEHTYMGGAFNDADLLNKTVGSGIMHIDAAFSQAVGVKTNHLPTLKYPLDINADNWSDVALRVRTSSNQLEIRTALSNKDGTFTPHVYPLNLSEKSDLTPMLSGYFDQYKESDLLLMERLPNSTINFITLLSDGQGSFTKIIQNLNYNHSYDSANPIIGDVNGDGYSDIILSHQHPTQGLKLLTCFSNGNGTFTPTEFIAGDGSGILVNGTVRLHAADVNGDKKTDLIYWWQGPEGFKIRTRISNGDGTFQYREYTYNGWINTQNIRSHVGDFNRDKKSDLIILDRDKNSGQLQLITFLSIGNGNYTRFIQKLAESTAVDTLASIVGDFNQDYKSDLLLRSRNSQSALVTTTYYADIYNNSYTKETQTHPDGSAVDTLPALLGKFDTNTADDLLLAYNTPQTGLEIRMKTKRRNHDFVHSSATPLGSFNTSISWSTLREQSRTQGRSFNRFGYPQCILPIHSGSLTWSGGGTFNPQARPSSGPLIQTPDREIKETNSTNGLQDANKPVPRKVIEDIRKPQQPQQLRPTPKPQQPQELKPTRKPIRKPTPTREQIPPRKPTPTKEPTPIPKPTPTKELKPTRKPLPAKELKGIRKL